MTRLPQPRLLTLATTALAIVGLASTATAQPPIAFPTLDVDVDVAEESVSFTLNAPTSSGTHVMLVGYVGVEDGNTQWSNFAKNVVPAIVPYTLSNANDAWTNLMTGISAEAPAEPFQIPPQAIVSQVGEIDWQEENFPNFAKPFTNGMYWPTQGWSTPGSSLQWGLSGFEESGHKFDIEQVTRAFLAKQIGDHNNTVLTRNSTEVNVLIKMIEKGLANFYLNVALVELHDQPSPTPPASPTIRISKMTPVQIHLTGEGNTEVFFFRYADEHWIHPAYLGAELTIEIQPQHVGMALGIAVPSLSGGWIVLPGIHSATTENGLTCLIPVPVGGGSPIIGSGQAGVIDLATGMPLMIPTPTEAAYAFDLYLVPQ